MTGITPDLDDWFFEKFILADESFAKAYEVLKLVYRLIIVYVENWFHH